MGRRLIWFENEDWPRFACHLQIFFLLDASEIFVYFMLFKMQLSKNSLYDVWHSGWMYYRSGCFCSKIKVYFHLILASHDILKKKNKKKLIHTNFLRFPHSLTSFLLVFFIFLYIFHQIIRLVLVCANKNAKLSKNFSYNRIKNLRFACWFSYLVKEADVRW